MQAKYPANFITILCLNYENLLSSTLTFRRCADGYYHLFVIFAVLDVSFAVNSCLNRGYLHYCYCHDHMVWGSAVMAEPQMILVHFAVNERLW